MAEVTTAAQPLRRSLQRGQGNRTTLPGAEQSNAWRSVEVGALALKGRMGEEAKSASLTERVAIRRNGCFNQGSLRKSLAIALLLALGLPFLAPLLALGQGVDASLPACCRRNGAHHCARSLEASRTDGDSGKHFRAPALKCPYTPAEAASAHPLPMGLPAAETYFRPFLAAFAGTAQTECRQRIPRDRSRQKRGPPMATLS